MSMCNSQCNVESRHKHAELQKGIQSPCKYYKQNCMCTSCMFDSSHCQDSCTPNCCANFCTRGLFPMLFTACTTVSQVRGRSPVPLSWASHFSTSCNIRSLSFDLFFSIPSKMADSTCKCVPKSLQWASRVWFRASITSTGQVKSDTTLQATWMKDSQSKWKSAWQQLLYKNLSFNHICKMSAQWHYITIDNIRAQLN